MIVARHLLISLKVKHRNSKNPITLFLLASMVLTSCKEFESKSRMYFDQSYSCQIIDTYESRGGFFMYSESLQEWLVLPAAINCSNGRIVRLSDRVMFQTFELKKDSLSSTVYFEAPYLKDSIEFNVLENDGSLWKTVICD